MRIRKVEPEDLVFIASLHKLAYKNDHFTSKFTINMLNNYYLELIKNNSYCYIALDEENKAIGFLIAGDKINYAINNFIKNNFFLLSTILLKNPSFWIEKIKSFIKIFQPQSPKSSFEKISLLSIAVDPNKQRKGIGEALIRHLEDDLKKDNIEYYSLYVRKDNIGAMKFYVKNDFELRKNDKKSMFFIKKISI